MAERARAAGLVPRFGRKVLEIRPPVEADKGTAVRQLLEEAGLRRALYAGDDTTDLDAFRGSTGSSSRVRVAVSSDEAPEELVSAADVVVVVARGAPGAAQAPLTTTQVEDFAPGARPRRRCQASPSG